VLIVLVCFFLPWVQVSCGGAHDALTGMNLARQDNSLLWLIPLLSCGVLVFMVLRRRAVNPQMLGMLSTFVGVIVLLLMNRQRNRALSDLGVIAVQLTGWFWLSFFAAVVIVVSGIAIILRRERVPVT
jgi:hypothetical protein